MSRKEQAKAFHGRGANCAQSVVCAFADQCEVEESTAMRVATGFGGGMGRMGGVCGAVTGAYMVLGLMHGMKKTEEADAKTMTYGLVREFAQKFRAKNATLSCKELLGIDISTEEGMRAAKEKNLFATRCNALISDAVDILESMRGS